jgi:uncharacterized OsmC-like protein
MYCEGGARGFKVAVDEPKQLGGTDRAMNLVELLLCSLGGCMSILRLPRRISISLLR